jgi:hypothetical protein
MSGLACGEERADDSRGRRCICVDGRGQQHETAEGVLGADNRMSYAPPLRHRPVCMLTWSPRSLRRSDTHRLTTPPREMLRARARGG